MPSLTGKRVMLDGAGCHAGRYESQKASGRARWGYSMCKASESVLTLCLGTCAVAFSQSESRSDLIASERTQKEANPTPETAPKGEIRVTSIEHSVPYKLLTGELESFGIGFGAIMPGSGIAILPGYTRTDLFGGRPTMRLDAVAAINQSYAGGLNLAMPNLFDGRGFWGLSVVHPNISEIPYCGPGPDSRKTGRSNYRLEDTKIEFRPGVRVFKGLRASLIGRQVPDLRIDTQYLAATITYGDKDARGDDSVRLCVRHGRTGPEVVGIDR